MRDRIQVLSAAFLGLCVTTIAGFHGMARAKTPDLARIRASLDALRESAGIRHIKYKVKVRIIKGSRNEFMEPPRLPGSGVDVPSEDLVTEPPPREQIDDFPRNRSWGKGSSVRYSIEKDAGGSERMAPYFEFSESASDGIESISISPKDRIDPRAIPEGIKVPVEVHRSKVSDDRKNQTLEKRLYPLFLSEGSLPSPDQPLPGRGFLQAFAPERWRVSGSTLLDGRECPVLVSAPNQTGEYDEYTLRPDLHYVACRLVRYYKGDPTQVVAIEYQPLEGRRPRLKSWKIQDYHPAGVLFTEESFTVESVKHLDSVDDSLFKLKPEDGMIVMDLDRMRFGIAGDEAASFATQVDANAYLERRAGSWNWVWIISLGALVVAGTGGVIVWARWRVSK